MPLNSFLFHDKDLDWVEASLWSPWVLPGISFWQAIQEVFTFLYFGPFSCHCLRCGVKSPAPAEQIRVSGCHCSGGESALRHSSHTCLWVAPGRQGAVTAKDQSPLATKWTHLVLLLLSTSSLSVCIFLFFWGWDILNLVQYLASHLNNSSGCYIYNSLNWSQDFLCFHCSFSTFKTFNESLNRSSCWVIKNVNEAEVIEGKNCHF